MVNLLSMLHSIPTVRSPTWWGASAEHDAKNWEVHWYPQTSAKTKCLTRMPTAEKTVKERDCTQMPVAKKDRRTGHKCLRQRKKRPNRKWWWQTKNSCPNQASKRKMAALIRQANSWHQMKETKQLKPSQKPKRWPTCKHKVKKTKTSPNHKFYRLLSATNEWTTTVKAIRAQSKNNCANDKLMESQTNHN